MKYNKFCKGKHPCPICKLTKPCDGGAFSHDDTKGQGKCHASKPGHECFCQDCQNHRWENVLRYHQNHDKIFLSIT